MRIRDDMLKDAVIAARKPQVDVLSDDPLLSKKQKQQIEEILRLHDAGFGDAVAIAAKVGNCTSAIELEKEAGPLVHCLSYAPDGPRKTLFERTQENFSRWTTYVQTTIETHRGGKQQ